MTTISLTFICGFTQFIEVEQKKSKKSKGKKKEKPKKDKNSKNSKKDKSPIKDEIPVVEISPFETEFALIVNVKKPIKYLHIEYNIIPKFNYKIDVVFWGTIAKVFTKDDIKAMKSINKGNFCWIAFNIQHKFVMETKELINLKSHTVNFSLNTDKNSVGASAKKEAEKTFYFLEEDVELNTCFAEAFETDPNPIYETYGSEETFDENVINIKHILDDFLNFPAKNEILNVLNIIPDLDHCKRTLSTLNIFMDKQNYNCSNSYEPGIDFKEFLIPKKKTKGKKKDKKKDKGKKGKGKKGKKDKKGKNKKDKKDNLFEISVNGETFFTDPNMTQYDFLKTNDQVHRAFLVIKVENLISRDQKRELNPIIVKVEKMLNIPEMTLTENRFTLIYASYKILENNYLTYARNISNDIYFKDHHIYFLEEDSLNMLSEQLQTGYLVVEIYGLRINESANELPELFGQNEKDEFINKYITKKTDILMHLKEKNTAPMESVLIAITCFKLDPLLYPVWEICKTELCIHPSRCVVPPLNKQDDNFEKITINTINVEQKISNLNPLTENLLLTHGTSLKMEVQLLRPINKILRQIIVEANSYNRMILIIYDLTFAKYILSNVILHNSYWLDKEDILPPNYLIKNEIMTIDVCSNENNIITGFAVDSNDFFIIFLEGNSRWIQNLFWKPTKKENVKSTKVFYNSDYVFKDRIYINFINYGGVYNITLQHSLKLMLTCSKIFSSGYIPEPCKRAYEKLDIILNSESIKEITNNLLPTMKELISLDIEWGIPVHWPLAMDVNYKNILRN